MNEIFKIQRADGKIEVQEIEIDADLLDLVRQENNCRYVKRDPIVTDNGVFMVCYPTYSTQDPNEAFCFKNESSCVVVQGTCFVELLDNEMQPIRKTDAETAMKHMELIRDNIASGMNIACTLSGETLGNSYMLQTQYRPIEMTRSATVPDGFDEQMNRVHFLLERNIPFNERVIQFMLMFSVFFKSKNMMPFDQTELLIDVESAREDLSRSQIVDAFKFMQDAQVSTLAASYRLLSQYVGTKNRDAMQFAFENMAKAIDGNEKLLGVLDMTEQEASNIGQACNLVSVFPEIRNDVLERAGEIMFPLDDYDTMSLTKKMIDSAEKKTEEALEKTKFIEKYFSVPQEVFSQAAKSVI